MSDRSRTAGGGVLWGNVVTVLSAAVLIGAEVFGAAYAAGWAVSSLFELGELGADILQGLFFLVGVAVMIAFIRAARRIEPFAMRR